MRRPLPLLLAFALCLGPRAARAEDPVAPARELQEAFVAVANSVRPAVVTLLVSGAASGDGGRTEFRTGGAGSGFVVDADGTIWTSNHVVEGSSRIEVVLGDGRRFKADLVGGDPASDFAVLRMLAPPDDLPVAALGSSDDLRVGQYAIAVGSPYGLDYAGTFSVGHVSALGRNKLGRPAPGIVAPGFERLVDQDFIQVDTPITTGNSGGPLFDIDGRVIGINTAIMREGRPGTVSLAFAIPVDKARELAPQLFAHGRVIRGWLGARAVDPDPELAELFGALDGVVVNEVVPASPAEAAGLREGDVIVELGDRPVRNAAELRSVVAQAPVGERLTMVVRRDTAPGKARDLRLDVTLVERPAELDEPAPRGELGWLETEVGLRLQPVDGARNKALGRKGSAPGVWVEDVREDSPADEGGLEPDDVLLEVAKKPVRSPQDVAEALRGSDSEFVPLLVERAGKQRVTAIAPPRP